MPIWWSALIVSAVVTNWLPFDPFWNSRLDRGIEELAFSRVKYERFQRFIHAAVTRRPALLLIEPDPSDRHIDFVYNDPDLSGPVIRGRYRPGKTDLAQVVADFPNRTIYLYNVKTARLRIVSSPVVQGCVERRPSGHVFADNTSTSSRRGSPMTLLRLPSIREMKMPPAPCTA